MTDRAQQAQQGFTLVEVLVAFVILSMVVVASLEIISGGVRATAVAEQRMTAAALAQTKFAELQSRANLAPGTTTGEFNNGYRWSLALTPQVLSDVPDWLETKAYGAHLIIEPDDAAKRQLTFSTVILSPFDRLADQSK